MMNTRVFDHNPPVPIGYTLPAAVCGMVLYPEMPPDHYPAGVYPEGPDDAIPDGFRAVSESRVIRDGLSVRTFVTEPIPAPEPPGPVPFAPITARQLRLWLLSAGIPAAAIDAQIAAIPDATQRAAAQIEWEYATQYDRTHPLVAQLGAALGLTDAQIDEAFRNAASL